MDYPKIPTAIRFINKQLVDHFGVSTENTNPIWRVSWSNDQFEKRKTIHTPSGIQLLEPMVMELPKYQHVKDRWILERLVLVPEFQQDELAGVAYSYECMWVFQDGKNEPVEPIFEAAKFVVDTVYAAMGKSSLRKYTDPESAEPLEMKNQRVDKLMEELFGDESSLLGRTITGEAIAMPTNYVKEK